MLLCLAPIYICAMDNNEPTTPPTSPRLDNVINLEDAINEANTLIKKAKKELSHTKALELLAQARLRSVLFPGLSRKIDTVETKIELSFRIKAELHDRRRLCFMSMGLMPIRRSNEILTQKRKRLARTGIRAAQDQTDDVNTSNQPVARRLTFE